MKRLLLAVLLLAAAAIAPRPAAALINGNTINPVTQITFSSGTIKNNLAVGGTSANNKITLNSASGFTQLILQRGGTSKWSLNNNVAGTDFLNVQNESLGVSAIALDFTNNNVGIGTVIPSAKLHVKTASADRNFHVSELSGILTLMGRNTADNGYIRTNIEAAPLSLNSNSGGNVGIGTGSPAEKLHVSSGTILVDGAGATIKSMGDIQFGRNGQTLSWDDGAGNQRAMMTFGSFLEINGGNAFNTRIGAGGGAVTISNGLDAASVTSSSGTWTGASPFAASTWTATYTGGSAFVCIGDDGVMFVSEAACP